MIAAIFNKSMQTERQLDFEATIKINNSEIENILCRAFLPLKVTDSIEFHFYFTEEQFGILSGLSVWKYSVKGELKSVDKETIATIEAETVYSNGMQIYPYNRFEAQLIGKPADLKITYLAGNSLDKEIVQGAFWVTSNRLLQPAFTRENNYTGEVKIDTVRSFEFSPNNDLNFKFNNYFHRYKNKENEEINFYELAAYFEQKSNEDFFVEETLQKLDDILLLASFAARERCICLGWEYTDSKTITKQYLRNRTFPINSDRDGNKYEELIDLRDFNEFMRIVYTNFSQYSDIDSFRRTLNLIIPKYNYTVEQNFISLYSSLEMIVLHFRRKQDIEFILEKKEFEKFRKQLKKFIDASEIVSEDTAKAEMKKKLLELNRISFASAFEQFCDFYSVDLSDLWSVNNNDDGVSLSKIRNKLVHGEHFNQKQSLGLFYAKEHLRWTIERMILALLGWDIEKSSVSPNYIQMMTPYLGWRKEAEKLKNS